MGTASRVRRRAGRQRCRRQAPAWVDAWRGIVLLAAWDLATVFNSCRVVVAEARLLPPQDLAIILERGASKTSTQSAYMEGKRRQNSTPELKERRR